METSPRKEASYKPSLKLVKSAMRKQIKNKATEKLLINTLTPLFTYKNKQGTMVSPKKYVLL